MGKVESTYIVNAGDGPWNAAQYSLTQRGREVTNKEIMEEIERLAKVNGCSSKEDFTEKFFKSVGTEVNIAPDKAHSTGNAEIDRINSLKDDTSRIIEYNKKNYDGKYYGIVDKKKCQLVIYDKKGKVIKTFTVGVGKKKGDDLQSYYLERAQKTDKQALAETGRYTTAGEFTLDDYKEVSDAYTGKDGKPKMMALKGDNRGVRSGQMALHMLYKPDYKKREKAINTPGLDDNRMSYGCINLKEEDYDAMHKFLGEGDKVYVLPEENGNKLLLEKQKDGSYKFAQQYHKNQKRSIPADKASQVKYDINPDRDPNNREESVWYKPWTWEIFR